MKSREVKTPKMEAQEIQKRFEEIQLRNIAFDTAQLRAENVGGKKYIRGYALLWDVPTKPYSWDPDYTEIIAKGALDGVDMADCRALVNHNPDLTLGRTSKNVRYELDQQGLFVEVEIHKGVQFHSDYWYLVEAGIIDGMSFAFRGKEWKYDEGTKTWIILKFDLIREVSVVTFPAYKETVAIAFSRAEAVRNAPSATDNPAPPADEKREKASEAGTSSEPAATDATADTTKADADAQRTEELYRQIFEKLGGTV